MNFFRVKGKEACEAKTRGAKPRGLTGSGVCPESVLEDKISSLMDLSPKGIREHLELNKPIYHRTAAYGHFGREPESDGGFSWEKTDLTDKIAALI